MNSDKSDSSRDLASMGRSALESQLRGLTQNLLELVASRSQPEGNPLISNPSLMALAGALSRSLPRQVRQKVISLCDEVFLSHGPAFFGADRLWGYMKILEAEGDFQMLTSMKEDLVVWKKSINDSISAMSATDYYPYAAMRCLDPSLTLDQFISVERALKLEAVSVSSSRGIIFPDKPAHPVLTELYIAHSLLVSKPDERMVKLTERLARLQLKNEHGLIPAENGRFVRSTAMAALLFHVCGLDYSRDQAIAYLCSQTGESGWIGSKPNERLDVSILRSAWVAQSYSEILTLT